MRDITILLIEDNLPDERLIREMLKDISHFKSNLISVVTLKDGCEQIQKNNFDIVLLDLNLPDSIGRQTFQKVIGCSKEIPIILITGIKDKELPLKLIKEGAQDYLTKQSLNPDLLGKSILYSIERQSLSRNIKIQKAEITRIEKERILLARFPSENPGPILRVAGNGKLLYINEAGIKLLPDWQLIINEIIPSRLKDIIEPIFIEGTNIEFELAHREFIYSFYAVPLIEDGYINLYGRDITGRVLAENELRESQIRYHELFDNISIGVAIYEVVDNGNDFIFKDFNRAGERIDSNSKEDVIGKSIYQVRPGIKKFGILDSFKRVYETGIPEYYPSRFYQDEQLQGWYNNFIYRLPTGEIVAVFDDITERMRAEEALRESEQRLNFHVNNSPLETIEWNTDFVVTRWSDEAEKIFGWNESETIGKPIMDLQMIYDEDIPIVQKTLERLSDGSSKHVVSANRNYTKSRKVIYCEWYNSVLLNPQGKMISVMSQVMDLTDRKRSEEALIKSEEKFRDMVEQINDVIFTTDANGIFTYLSPAVEILGGYKPEDLIGHFIGEFLDPLFVPKVIEQFQKVMTGILEPMEYRVKVKSGDYQWVRSSSKPILKENIPTGIRGVLTNINERKRAEEELRESYAFNESLLKTIPFGMDIVDEEGTVLFQSDNFKSLFGAKSIGKKCWELYRDNKTQCDDCPLIIGITYGFTDTYESYGILGNRIFEIIHTGMIYDGKKAILEIFHDITDKKEKEQELIIAKEHAEESDRLKSAFLANMSHEIRTPMNGILGFADLLKEPDLTGEQQQEYIRIIEKSGARMLNIINNIVDISKIESGQMKVNIKESNINEKIEFIHTFFKPETENKGIDFSFKNGLSANEAIIKTDQEKIYAILTNLVKNAIKYCDKGSIEFGYVSTLRLAQSSASSTTDSLGSVSEPGSTEQSRSAELQFYVKDTGTGIPKNRQQAIFDRFIQADIADNMARQGAGLGLSISKAYVEMLGGQIWVESEEGIGSTFYFTIPYHAEQEEEPGSKNIISVDEAISLIKKLKILIVEDDEESEKLLEIEIKKFNKKVLKAKTGVEAIEVCRNNPDLDLVLMDIKMPEMDGYEATRQIRQFNKDLVIVAQTAFAQSGDREKAIEAGCNDHISKPIKKDDLMVLIHKYFKRQHTISIP